MSEKRYEKGLIVPTVDCSKVECRWVIRIPMRDGVRLHGTLYVPRGQIDPKSCVLAMTPYMADGLHARGMYFAARGLLFLAVDVRGRGGSEGEFRPFIQEAKDGYDAVEWLARQPYCDGRVAMMGGSYLGYAQWATAKELPPHLATIVPTAAPYIGRDFPMRGNIFYPAVVKLLAVMAGRTAPWNAFSDAALWSGLFQRWHESGRAFGELDTFVGSPSKIFQEWLEHPHPDDYWDSYNPTAEQYARLEIQILTVTGHYDDDQPGALEHYQGHLRNTSAAARERHYLVIGPWDHARTATSARAFGGVTFGPESLVDLIKLHRDWYAWTLEGGPKPEFLRKPVAYYVMGAERWRYADTLEGTTARHEAYFLDSSGGATDAFSAGSLGTFAASGGPDTYTYDPREVNGPEVAAEAQVSEDSLVDQTVLFALRGRVLVYHSAPFAKDTELSGFFKLSAWIAIDCPDTDLFVSVYEIDADGRSLRLSTDAIRARYRQGLRTPKLICTREPLRYDFERFTFVSRQIKRGHRLRLVVAPTGRPVETTFVERNYNGGGVVAEESVKQARPVTVRLFHDEARPSALSIPLGQPVPADETEAPASALLGTA